MEHFVVADVQEGGHLVMCDYNPAPQSLFVLSSPQVLVIDTVCIDSEDSYKSWNSFTFYYLSFHKYYVTIRYRSYFQL